MFIGEVTQNILYDCAYPYSLFFNQKKSQLMLRSLQLIKLIFYNPFIHIFIASGPYIAGTVKHKTIDITTNIQATTQIKIFNRLGAFLSNNIYIHKIK